MKIFYVLTILLCCLGTHAQHKTETYYDYNWKPCDPLKARFYSVLQHTDSGWLRFDYFVAGTKLQMKALYEDSACKIQNGQSVFFYANGQLESMGREVHGKQEGICVAYHSNGMIADSASYHNGVPVGNNYSWYPNGSSKDSTAHINDSLDVEVSWFDDGTPASAGHVLNDKMHGKWQFFHPSGKLSAVEVYDHGKPISKVFFNEDGSVQPDTSKAERAESFPGGKNEWITYLNRNLYFPPNYEFARGDMAVVLVDMTINENGQPENVEVAVPFHPAFDKIALDVLRKCPPWKPRISHNRRVKARFRQPVVFREEE